jgi:hypothetical protein
MYVMQIIGKEICTVLEAISKSNPASKTNTEAEDANSVKVMATNGALMLISTTRTVDIAYRMRNVQIASPFNVTLDNSDLSKKLKTVTNKDGTVNVEEASGSITASGNGNICLTKAEPKQKKFPNITEDAVLSFVSEDLVRAISLTNLAVGGDNEVLKKVKITLNPEEATFGMLGFNGKILSTYSIPLEDMNEDAEVFEYLIDGKMLSSLSSLFKAFKSEIINVAISKEQGLIQFSTFDLKVVIPFETTEFVKCEELLKKSYDSFITFDTKTLKKSVSSISKVVKDAITIESDGVTSKFSANGFSQDATVVKSSAVKLTIPISILSSVLSNASGDTITIAASGEYLVKIESDASVLITSQCK